jgi:hypothetical protein
MASFWTNFRVIGGWLPESRNKLPEEGGPSQLLSDFPASRNFIFGFLN